MKISEKKIIATLGILILASSFAFSEGDIKFELPKKSYKVGDNISADFLIKNPTSQKKTYKVVMVCSKAINEEPGCREVYVEVEPGQSVTGKISDMANLAVDTEASFKVIDTDTGELISEQNESVKILDPGDIVCGDGKCEADEDYDNCPLDCEKKAACGDGTCYLGENSTSCPKDCAATTSTTQPKPAETMNFMDYLPYAAGLLVLVVIIGTAAFIMKKGGAKKIEKQKADFEKWQREREDLK